MKRLMTPGAAIAATVALSACGGGGGGGGDTPSAAGSGSKTVSVQELPGAGRVLVAQDGKAIYSSDQEASGKIVCTGACTAFWTPVKPGSGTPTAGPGAGKLGVIKRPDGSMQVTANHKPLYTFAEDSPGKVTGDGFTDDFDGRHFVWNVVSSGAKTASGGSSKSAPDTTGPSSDYGGY